MASVDIPKDTIPSFDALYEDRIGTPNDFEAVEFYADFTRLMTNRIMTPSMQQQVMGYFQISFITDPALDLMCAEAYSQESN